MFQSTFPQGERPALIPFSAMRKCFNPRSRKGNDSPYFSRMRFLHCFNPRSRKGNDPAVWFSMHHSPVSIHVPARGTTQRLVSIHVPARGTTAIIYKFPLYFLLLSMQLYQYNPGNASPADHTHLTLSQYYGANLPDTLCPLLFRTDPVLHCCFI